MGDKALAKVGEHDFVEKYDELIQSVDKMRRFLRVVYGGHNHSVNAELVRRDLIQMRAVVKEIMKQSIDRENKLIANGLGRDTAEQTLELAPSQISIFLQQGFSTAPSNARLIDRPGHAAAAAAIAAAAAETKRLEKIRLARQAMFEQEMEMEMSMRGESSLDWGGSGNCKQKGRGHGDDDNNGNGNGNDYDYDYDYENDEDDEEARNRRIRRNDLKGKMSQNNHARLGPPPAIPILRLLRPKPMPHNMVKVASSQSELDRAWEKDAAIPLPLSMGELREACQHRRKVAADSDGENEANVTFSAPKMNPTIAGAATGSSREVSENNVVGQVNADEVGCGRSKGAASVEYTTVACNTYSDQNDCIKCDDFENSGSGNSSSSSSNRGDNSSNTSKLFKPSIDREFLEREKTISPNSQGAKSAPAVKNTSYKDSGENSNIDTPGNRGNGYSGEAQVLVKNIDDGGTSYTIESNNNNSNKNGSDKHQSSCLPNENNNNDNSKNNINNDSKDNSNENSYYNNTKTTTTTTNTTTTTTTIAATATSTITNNTTTTNYTINNNGTNYDNFYKKDTDNDTKLQHDLKRKTNGEDEVEIFTSCKTSAGNVEIASEFSHTNKHSQKRIKPLENIGEESSLSPSKLGSTIITAASNTKSSNHSITNQNSPPTSANSPFEGRGARRVRRLPSKFDDSIVDCIIRSPARGGDVVGASNHTYKADKLAQNSMVAGCVVVNSVNNNADDS